MNENPELHPDRYGGDDIYETKKVAEHWHTEDMYRGWLVITIEKYCSRYGKKDDKLKEAYKIANYGKFLVEFEEKVAAGMDPKEAYHQVEEKIEPEEAYHQVEEKIEPEENYKKEYSETGMPYRDPGSGRYS